MTRKYSLRDGLIASTAACSLMVCSHAFADSAAYEPTQLPLKHLQLAQAAGTDTPTDIGRVTTSGGVPATEGLQAKPSGTGTRAQAKAAEHRAINKIIVQPQSEIEKLPDVSIAQALSRLPGISMETDSGEGRFIDIRGLDADLNATTFDGVRILPSNLSSPTGGGRAVAYDVLPAGLVGGIEVSETLRPEDDAEGLGGLVNLLPRRPKADGQPIFRRPRGWGLRRCATRRSSITALLRAPASAFKPAMGRSIIPSLEADFCPTRSLSLS